VTVTQTLGTGNGNGIGGYNGATSVGNTFTYVDNRFKGNTTNEVNAVMTQLPRQ
jgi:hypothetical protein